MAVDYTDSSTGGKSGAIAIIGPLFKQPLSQAELDALLPAVLDRAFRGEL